MNDFWKKAIKETLLAAACTVVFCLFAVALFAVIVRAYAPSDVVVYLVTRLLKGLAVFGFTLLFVHGERALFKGMAAGVSGLLFTTLVFGIIGGFRMTAFFPVELVVAALLGGAGAVCGAKLRKE